MDAQVVVIGGGHAAIEAASAASRMGCQTLLVTQSLEAIGRMSCNPAIGGVAKGQLVREIEALGGEMGLAADANGIHFRMLNASRGPAVWGPRAQQDMDGYSLWMRRRLEGRAGLGFIQAEVLSLETCPGGVELFLSNGTRLQAQTVVLTTGTFAAGKLHRGEEAWDGGRIGEAPAQGISASLTKLGFTLKRLKTGTPARLRRDSIDWSLAEEQPGDAEPWAFSPRSPAISNRILCHIVRTTAETHVKLREGFDRSPLFNGRIVGAGPRYCPSIEDKVSRFSERESHQLFLEPEGLGNDRVYVNGFSSSLPADIQDAALRTIPSLARCEVIRYGYAVEYDAVDATELHPTLESKRIPGLYLAGQTCGTSGYEEAAAQGLVAGANAAAAALGRAPILFDRATSYIGVLVDDLISTPLVEPYRLFTSRAEHRLFLRHDNAEERLTEIGSKAGLVDEAHLSLHLDRQGKRKRLRLALDATPAIPDQIRPFLQERSEPVPEKTVRLIELARRPGVGLQDLVEFCHPDGAQGMVREDWLAVESDVRYEGFRQRELREIERVRRLSGHALPLDVDWSSQGGLSIEAREAIARHKPMTVGQAARLAGVRPADVEILLMYL